MNKVMIGRAAEKMCYQQIYDVEGRENGGKSWQSDDMKYKRDKIMKSLKQTRLVRQENAPSDDIVLYETGIKTDSK